jgi:hypothetical protein
MFQILTLPNEGGNCSTCIEDIYFLVNKTSPSCGDMELQLSLVKAKLYSLGQ